MRVLLLVLASASRCWAAGGPWSATVLFESTVQLHFVEAKNCWGQRKLPSQRMIQREIRGMLQGCDRFWPGDESAPYRLMTVMITESGGNTRNTAKPQEHSYGPWCGTPDECRETHRLHPDIPCPRSKGEIVERLESDPEWAALVACATIWRYDRAQGGDQIMGLLTYKFGTQGLCNALARLGDHPPTDLAVWQHTATCFAWVRCLRDRVMVDSTPPCGCMAPDR